MRVRHIGETSHTEVVWKQYNAGVTSLGKIKGGLDSLRGRESGVISQW